MRARNCRLAGIQFFHTINFSRKSHHFTRQVDTAVWLIFFSDMSGKKYCYVPKNLFRGPASFYYTRLYGRERPQCHVGSFSCVTFGSAHFQAIKSPYRRDFFLERHRLLGSLFDSGLRRSFFDFLAMVFPFDFLVVVFAALFRGFLVLLRVRVSWRLAQQVSFSWPFSVLGAQTLLWLP